MGNNPMFYIIVHHLVFFSANNIERLNNEESHFNLPVTGRETRLPRCHVVRSRSHWSRALSTHGDVLTEILQASGVSFQTINPQF